MSDQPRRLALVVICALGLTLGVILRVITFSAPTMPEPGDVRVSTSSTNNSVLVEAPASQGTAGPGLMVDRIEVLDTPIIVVCRLSHSLLSGVHAFADGKQIGCTDMEGRFGLPATALGVPILFSHHGCSPLITSIRSEMAVANVVTIQLLPGNIVSGQVIDQDGRPLSEVRLRVRSGEASKERFLSSGNGLLVSPYPHLQPVYERTQLTGPDGTFVLPGLASSRHTVELEKFGYVTDRFVGGAPTGLTSFTCSGSLSDVRFRMARVYVGCLYICDQSRNALTAQSMRLLGLSSASPLYTNLPSPLLLEEANWRAKIGVGPAYATHFVQAAQDSNLDIHGVASKWGLSLCGTTVWNGSICYQALNEFALERVQAAVVSNIPEYASIQIYADQAIEAHFLHNGVSTGFVFRPVSSAESVYEFRLIPGNYDLRTSSGRPFVTPRVLRSALRINSGTNPIVDLRGLPSEKQGIIVVRVLDINGMPTNDYHLQFQRRDAARTISFFGKDCGETFRKPFAVGDYMLSLLDKQGQHHARVGILVIPSDSPQEIVMRYGAR